ncbi:DNA cytosine methyltransferase [Candidatus Dojkabacteria bacterium]|jgi:DNA-cytosine methyltransferase|nr:DNA cytosine methyltransferase [Candidatus Dojkabacteria bacterium]
MNVLSLFDGISCGRLALERANIEVDNYYASEIDKYAIQVAQYNYPNNTQLGDVTKVNGSDLPKINLLIGGSPCQGFSFAGKQLNFNDPRSKLFFEFVRLKNECNPEYFLLENVDMKEEYQDIISGYLGVKPIIINSNLVSAQNRKRLYWTNIPIKNLPIDKKLFIKDIRLNCAKTSHRNIDIFKQRKTTNYIQFDPKDKGNNSYDARVYFDDKKFGALRASGNVNYIFCCNGNIRRMHPIEWERLQTLPDDYTSCVSNSQRYKMIGNGWTVDIISHIFGFLNND